ncbi:hypothetical protein GQ53DRAFT_743417 [Thozetella sp. PMI_491]|nr:hypothetical protein GQ53DRAFT_743417 [Thozetella sp. PMI_491]
MSITRNFSFQPCGDTRFEYQQNRLVEYGYSTINRHPSQASKAAYESYRTITHIVNNTEECCVELRETLKDIPYNGRPAKSRFDRCSAHLSRDGIAIFKPFCRIMVEMAIRHCNERAAFLRQHPYAYQTLEVRKKHEAYLGKAIRQLGE